LPGRGIEGILADMLREFLSRVSVVAGSDVNVERLRSENSRLAAALAKAEGDCVRLAAEIEDLRGQVTAAVSLGENLKQQLSELKARLGTNSHNSSKPPSSDGPEVPKRPTKPKGRQPGGQRGHKGQTRSFDPPATADHCEAVKPTACASCGEALSGEDAAPLAHWVVDIPDPRLIFSLFLLHRLCCAKCGHWTRATPPAGQAVGESPYGVRVHALVGLLVGRFKQGKRGVVELFETLYGLRMGPGTVSAIEGRLSLALAVPVAEARAHIQASDVVNMDETSWRQMRSRAWLWLAATGQVAVFFIDRRRGGPIVSTILGTVFTGALGVDRWSAYKAVALRQLCWAHLLRDFIAMAERFQSPWHGQRLALCACQVMALWNRCHRGEIDRATMLAEMAPLRARVKQHLTWAAKSAPGAKARSKAAEILKVEPLLWTFLDVLGMAPTNNLAERLLRYAVIWRKLSFGTQSERGRLFVERLLTVTSTLTLQKRNVFAYLCLAMTAYAAGKPAPSILPVSSKG